MRYCRTGLIALLLFGFTTAPIAEAGSRGFAVVELFTSEGCSSCPPADAVLAEIAVDARISRRDIYCLSFHVDYWNRLGWKDPYSKAAYTQRQEEYSQLLQLDNVYTPQMVVNGIEEFIGSKRVLAAQAIELLITQSSEVSVTLQAVVDKDTISVEYNLEGVPVGAVLNVAWVEAQATSKPDRGENRGQTLRHINIVRDFHVIELTEMFNGKVSLDRQQVKSGTIIGYVQDPSSGQILGVSSVEMINEG